jgi:ElaB/YqjD/DUF883 family membrane-anchored ribosome-binding protein
MVEERDDIETTHGVDLDEPRSATSDTRMTAGADLADGTAETEKLKDQIEETRSEIGETIGAIQEKLTYSNISEQVSDHVNTAVETAKGAIYAATVGKATSIMKNIGDELSDSSIVKTAKQNPLPFILMGVGAGLLAYQTYGAKPSKTRTRFISDPQSGRYPSETTHDGVSDKLSDMTGKVGDAAGTVYDKVTGAAGSVYSGATDAVGQVYDKAGELGTSVRSKYETQIEDNPLAVGALALAMGAAVGLTIPSTRYEGKLMGNARQGLMEKAQHTATDAIDKTKEVVSEAGRTIADQARSAIAE